MVPSIYLTYQQNRWYQMSNNKFIKEAINEAHKKLYKTSSWGCYNSQKTEL